MAAPMSPLKELPTYFPLQCECVEIRGIEVGVLLKFQTFYLKVYSDWDGMDNYGFHYKIQGFRYNEYHPIFEEIVHQNKIREFASSFTHEWYLKEFETE